VELEPPADMSWELFTRIVDQVPDIARCVLHGVGEPMLVKNLPQMVRYGFLGPLHWAVVEAADVTAGGGVVLTASVGASNTYLHRADKVLLEVNARHPASLLGLHDIWEPKDPPARSEIPVFHVSDRVGSPICAVDPKKIAGVVLTDLDDESTAFGDATALTEQIGRNIAEFLVAEMKSGRLPPEFLPLQSGVGDIANSVLGALGESREFPDFQMYTEVVRTRWSCCSRAAEFSTCALRCRPR
jgi:acetyl-CoA hydrolase